MSENILFFIGAIFLMVLEFYGLYLSALNGIGSFLVSLVIPPVAIFIGFDGMFL